MQEEAFRVWLETRGARTPAGRNTRTHAIRMIEKKMAALGSPHSDLEAAFRADKFAHLRERLRELRENFKNGGTDYRILMPSSEKPLNRLTSWRSWLSQYERFLNGDPKGERDADRIREYVLEHYIEPAREQDLDSTDVLVRDINQALSLNQAWTNICQALKGIRFLEMADVEPPEQIGADQSPATVFRFQLTGDQQQALDARPFVLFNADGAAFKPVLNHNRATGRSAYRVKPQGASNKAEEALEVDRIADVASAMLREGLPARLQSVNGGPVNYLVYGKQKLVRYELDPSIAEEIGVPPRGQIDQGLLDPDALGRLRALFIEKHPTFRTFLDGGTFRTTEDEYKRAKIERARKIISESAITDNRTLGAALLDLIVGKGGSEGNLLGWRMADGLAKARKAHGTELEAAAGLLARADVSFESVMDFVASCWPILSEGQEKSLPYGDSRTIPTMLRALLDPGKLMGIRTTPTDNASMMLRGKWAFKGVLTGEQLSSVISMAHEIFSVMQDEWRWAPRDLWDVQGFLWETCQKRLPTPNELKTSTVEAEQRMAQPTNLILYGPPGTGKTYATVSEAVRLCGEVAPKSRDELMSAYRRLSDAGRIEFVTFHQSIAYEDFVEGLRPTQTNDDGAAGFQLKAEPGVFRRIARRAETSTGPGTANYSVAGRQVFKMSIGEAANPDDTHLFEEAVAGGYTLLGFDDIDWADSRFEDRAAMIEACRKEGIPGASEPTALSGRVQMPSIFRNRAKRGDIIIVSKGNSVFRAIGEITGDYEFAPREGGGYAHRRAVNWLWVDRAGVPVDEVYARSFTMKPIYLLAESDLNVPALERYIASQQNAGSGAPEQFVLVIDEINRANISKAFGELITLLEGDKRIGQPNALKVRLPYSGDVFGVPSNLHIIGTMNTADRSIALLDTALRRRFEFRELMPDPSLLKTVDGVDVAALLEKLNERIEFLFDREHQVGHAYFMGCQTRADLDQVIRHKVIPLLAEYFYEDWTKVAAVLGDADDLDGDREGRFINRRILKSPPGTGSDDDRATRYRWSVRDTFSYDSFLAG